MINDQTIAVVIPCYKVTGKIDDVIRKLPSYVDHIVIVDDKCPDNSGKYVEDRYKNDDRVHVLYNEKNLGVGGAVKHGCRYSIENEFDYTIKIDGDDQMDSSYIAELVELMNEVGADYSKGSRFRIVDHMLEMPRFRLFGNLGLNFLNKIASGYYSVTDPTNGFFCIRRRALKRLSLDKVANNFFFESDLLFRLYLIDAKVVELPMPAIYGDEKSNLNEFRAIPTFLYGMFTNLYKRIIYTYLLKNFGLPTFMLFASIPLLFFGFYVGITNWFHSGMSGEFASAGTVMLAALPIMLGTQFFLGFLTEDMRRGS